MSAIHTYRILVTGAAGAIGRPICEALRERGHFVRGLDLAAAPTVDESVIGSITDPAAIDAAMRSMDTLVHLAAEPDDADFVARLMPLNVLGVYNVLEAARTHALRRVVLASSIQAGGRRDESGMLRVDGDSPRNHYAVTKLFAESMGKMYHQKYGLSVVAVRIGWFTRNVNEAIRLRERGAMRFFLSHRDARQFLTCAVEALPVGFTTVFAVSRQTDPSFSIDLGPARALGYEPVDVFPEGLPFTVPD